MFSRIQTEVVLGEPNSTSVTPNPGFPAPMHSPDLSIRIPKNRSTGNLLVPPHTAQPVTGRTRFSFDAGSEQEMKNLKRYFLLINPIRLLLTSLVELPDKNMTMASGLVCDELDVQRHPELPTSSLTNKTLFLLHCSTRKPYPSLHPRLDPFRPAIS